jgi:hypothetical protein
MTISPTSIGLSWSPPASGGAAVYGYTIVERVTGSDTFEIIAVGLTSTSYEVTGLKPTTSYDFGVFGANQAGPGPMSVITQATQGEVPNAPTGLVASAGSPSFADVTLSWTAPTTDSTNGPASSYAVQYALHGTGSWTTAARGVTLTSYTVTGLAHATNYDFQVIGMNSAGSGPASNTATLATTTAPPNVPGSFTMTAGTPTDTAINLSWDASVVDGMHDAPTSYTVYWQVNGAGSYTAITGLSGSPYSLTGLSLNTQYDAYVEAVNAGGVADTAVLNLTTSNYLLSSNNDPQTSSWSPDQTSFGINASDNSSSGDGSHPSPYQVYFACGTSDTMPPASGWLQSNNANSTPLLINGHNSFYLFTMAPGAAGTYYVWAQAVDSSGDILAGPIVLLDPTSHTPAVITVT